MPDNGSPRAPRYPFTRSNAPAEPSLRAPTPDAALRGRHSDPLTELARLIGQSEPFVDPVPEAARRDLREILSGRRNTEWPAAAEPAPSDQYDDYASLAPEHDDFPPVPPVDELPHLGELPAQPPFYAPTTEYGQKQPDGPVYGDNGQLLTGSHPDDRFATDQYPADSFAGDETPARSRKGLFAVIAVFGLAVLGTAGAYGYRTMYGGAMSGAPPLIRANSSPNKVAAAQVGDNGSGKQIYDRLGNDRPQNEKIVSREEQPVDVRPAQTRSTYPGSPPQANQPAPAGNSLGSSGWPSPAGTATPPSGGPASANEPRRIRTIPIRSDQLAAAPPADAQPAAAPPPAAVTPPRSSPPPRQYQAAPSPTPPAAGGPLSLNPQGAAEPRIPPPTRNAAVAPRAAAETATGSGSYVVQIAANKTHEEASEAFRAAQAKYPSVLSGRKPLIRKKEVAGKGTFYGAQVGPFASRDDAAHLCENLKSAGGTCIVQRN